MRKGLGGDCSGKMEGLAQRSEGRNSVFKEKKGANVDEQLVRTRDRRTGANYAMPQCPVLKKAGFYSE